MIKMRTFVVKCNVKSCFLNKRLKSTKVLKWVRIEAGFCVKNHLIMETYSPLGPGILLESWKGSHGVPGQAARFPEPAKQTKQVRYSFN